jgi:hypothetical protein
VLVRLRLAVVVVALCALTSCIARSGVAVSGSDQTVKLHLARCDSEERVSWVKVATAGRNKIPDDDDDHVLWEARAEQPGVELDEVVVGLLPPGMVQTVPLTEQLEPSGKYYGLIESGVEGIAYFKPAQLREDSVLYNGRQQSAEAFRKAVRTGGKCATGSSISTGELIVQVIAVASLIGVGVGAVLLVRRRRNPGPRTPG